MAETILGPVIRSSLFKGIFGTSSGVPLVPSNAIRDRAGNPILDRFGAFILTRS